MYTVIIADDNTKVCDGVKFLIDKSFSDIEIIGIYNDGNSILSALDQRLPDILICDICMPGPDGIEICRRIRERTNSTQIILITAFQKFEYARKAINFRVSDFLIKPYASTQLIDAIKSAKSYIEKNLGYAQAVTSLYFVNRNRISKMVKEFYYSGENIEELKAYRILNETSTLDKLHVYEVDFILGPPLNKKPANLLFEFDSQYLSSFYIETNKEHNTVIFCKDVLYLNNFLTDCSKTADMSGSVLSYTIIGEMNLEQWELRCRLRSYALKFSDKIHSLDSKSIKSYIEELSSQLVSAQLCLLISLAKVTLSEECDFNTPEFNNNTYDLSGFADYCLKSLTKNRLSAGIKQYIYDNYQNPNLSVASIAGALNLNSNYISGKFKDETGLSITTFINSTRIDQATKLFTLNGNVSNETVAKEVGYNDVAYFRRIFKNTTGVTPSHFHRKEGK